MREYITILDYIILPFVLLLVYGIAIWYRNKHYPLKHPFRKYFLPALTVKILGAIFIGLVYQHYYGDGDTFNFFKQAQIVNSSFKDSPNKWLNLVLFKPSLNALPYYNYISNIEFYNDTSSYMIIRITAIISIFFGGTYLPTAVIFASISFTGVWALFITFANLYPQLRTQVAIATLFIPSTIIWGSGIFKDTICLLALGWLTFSVFRILVKYDFKLSNLILCLLSLVLVANIKIYILLAFLPAALLWILFIYTNRISGSANRILLRLISVTVLVGVLIISMQVLGDEALGRYSLKNIESTASITRDWILYSSGDEGSGYSLGDFDGSLTGMIAKFPLALNVTLFRPYIWESRKVIVLLSAVESLIFLFLTLKLLFSINPFRVYKTIVSDPTVQFCFIFAIIFAFAVGISTYNFGALSRYKIPCLPFYLLFIILAYYKNAHQNKKLMPLFNL